MNKYSWLSAHLYSYDIPLNEIIYDFIPSFLKKIKEKVVIKKYFYIRYFDDVGVHIRLRLLIQEIDIKNVKLFLDTQYGKFVSLKRNQKNTVKEKELVRYIIYQPEIERYGGNKAIIIAESFFYLSSKTILNIIKRINLRDYSISIPAALKLHLLFLYSLNCDKETLKSLLLTIMDHWMLSALTKLKKEKNLIPYPSDSKDCLEHFKINYERNRTNILHILNKKHSLIDTDQYKKNPLLKRWEKHNTVLFSKLCLLKNKLNSKNNNHHNHVAENPFHIALSFIHMTNNRMGIQNSDESYLAYILLRFLDEDTFID